MTDRNHPMEESRDVTEELADEELEPISGGVAPLGIDARSIAAFPDVCKTPAPGGPIPVPYPTTTEPSAKPKISPKRPPRP